MANHPSRGRLSPALALAHEMFPRRGTIRRSEMADYLRALESRGLDLSASGYAPRLRGEASHGDFDGRGDAKLAVDLPDAWAAACRGITLVSVVDGATDPGAPASVNQGSIRYDEPGNTYPGFRVTVMFAPASLRDEPYDQIGQMRRYCRRLIVVR